jgi:hypothetical protein
LTSEAQFGTRRYAGSKPAAFIFSTVSGFAIAA